MKFGLICRCFCICVFTVISACATFLPAATYHVANRGDDANDGLSPQKAWATLARVNRAALVPGDSVLFHRGDTWRGTLLSHSGDGSKQITYGAYGEGPKPLLLGSVAKSKPTDWTDGKNGLWSADGFRNDVGNIIFDGGKSCGVKVWRESDLKRDGQYWFDLKRKTVKLRLSENPAKCYGEIECAVREHVILQNQTHHVIYENLAVKYGAAHGIAGGETHHIIVRDCDFGFIGGGDQYTDGRRTVRFGNGIEFWGAAHDNLVERCRLWEIYDAALTNQSHGPRTPEINITYRNNVIWNSEYSFEYWNRPEDSETRNVKFINNTCVNAGYGWGHSQRPDPSGCHLRFYPSPAKASGIVVSGNIFDGATGPAFYAPQWSAAQIDALEMDRNCWRQESGVMIQLPGANYTMADFAKYQAKWQKEPHSICADPLFVDRAKLDFRLLSNSPCVGMGVMEYGK